VDNEVIECMIVEVDEIIVEMERAGALRMGDDMSYKTGAEARF